MTTFKQDQDGKSILVLVEGCHQTCMTYTSVESTVENSWWWKIHPGPGWRLSSNLHDIYQSRKYSGKLLIMENPFWSWLKVVIKPAWHIPVSNVQWKTPDDGKSFLILVEGCHQTCMTYTSVECTMENSWWWAEELPETCRVSWQINLGN